MTSIAWAIKGAPCLVRKDNGDVVRTVVTYDGVHVLGDTPVIYVKAVSADGKRILSGGAWDAVRVSPA